MPRRKKVPGYCRHKATDQAYVTINGREVYLGRFGSPGSREKYAQIIAEQYNSGEAKLPQVSDSPSIADLILNYWTEHVAKSYVKDGKPTDRQYHIRIALRPLRRLFGSLPASDFSPKKLRTVREEMIRQGTQRGRGVNRRYINDHISIIKRMFRWAASEELVPLEVHQSLQTLEGLRKGFDERVTEPKKIRPVAEDLVTAVMKAASPQIRTMIGIQQLTGMRPDEVTVMRPCDVDQTGVKSGMPLDGVWIYVPSSHKLEWREIDRFVALGPRCQQLLLPWLNRKNDAYLFSPREAARHRYTSRPTKRKAKREVCKSHFRDHYDDETYCQAVTRICDRLKIPRWTPNQLRHTAATKLRKQFGLEAARVVLGHQTTTTTEIYAERDLLSAVEIMRQTG